ncbi:cation:proton antiporter [Floccifex sp.]|uniref:cation:proton antiporter n=1 Tax=Floccifex sp. TaxID=2815810 RepID=UPI002A762E16|nr:cation:proton antiporter [Floccifex sp.]MDD7281544.1 cation:proton antiporter [Erysipelotrichaceae bacterium]MDY2957505.1 cation:proton antiporter [Floccifex sp.]
MEYSILRDLAIIVVMAKTCGIIARKFKIPQVCGEIIAGLLIGPSVLGWVQPTDFLAQMAEIGVILLMFSAGLESDLHDLMKTGPKAFAIACGGVFVPLVLGALMSFCFNGFAPIGSLEFFQNVFIGCIMTATSVSITVQTLKEMGKLSTQTGTTIVSAAIIDDVIGIIVLTVLIGFKDTSVKPASVIINTILFFILSLVLGVIIYRFFKKLDKDNPHTRRIPIYGLALCLIMAYVAETVFGIADITGAFMAGLILCNIDDSSYIDRKMEVSNYMFFGPVFFASIGLKTQIDHISMQIIVFSIAFIIVALLAKIIGCGLIAKICGFDNKDSIRIGVGMMTRGEVALIVAQKGLSVGLMDSVLFTSVILLIIVSSVTTPILLKLLYKEDPTLKNA